MSQEDQDKFKAGILAEVDVKIAEAIQAERNRVRLRVLEVTNKTLQDPDDEVEIERLRKIVPLEDQ